MSSEFSSTVPTAEESETLVGELDHLIVSPKVLRVLGYLGLENTPELDERITLADEAIVLELNKERYNTVRDNRPVHLRPLAFSIAYYLGRKKDAFTPKAELLHTFWGAGDYSASKTFDVTLRYIRQTLGGKHADPKRGVIRYDREAGYTAVSTYKEQSHKYM